MLAELRSNMAAPLLAAMTILAGCTAPVLPSSGVPTSEGESSDDGDRQPKTDSVDPTAATEVGQWKWVDVPGAVCANGQPTGMGINKGTGNELLIFLEGGGACWDETTCFGVEAASNVSEGFAQANFDAAMKDGSLAQGVFNRKADNNPFRTASVVYIPYCTGDVHAGDATRTIDGKEVHFVGRKNIDAYLAKLVPSFAQASRVTLAGVSAGGFGSAINYWRVQDAFGKVRVDLIDDSGPMFDQSSIKFFSEWKSAWNLDGAFPADCSECRTNVRSIPAYYAKKYPSSRLSLLSFDHDATISLFFVMLPSTFAEGLGALTKDTLAPLANMRYFVPEGAKHTMLRDLTTRSGDTDLGTWLTELTTDSRDWQNVSL